MYDIIALGCGLVGKFVVTKLSSLGYKIHVIDLVIPSDIKENSEISCEEGDVFQIVNDLPKAKVILNQEYFVKGIAQIVPNIVQVVSSKVQVVQSKKFQQ